MDQSCWYANNFDKHYLAVPDPDTNSIVHAHIKQIKKGVDFHRKNMTLPSKQRNEFTEAIRELAAGFIKLFPAAQISHHLNSKFSRLVCFWLKEYNQVSIKKPHRHIQKAIGKDPK